MAASELEGAPMPSLSGQQYFPKSRKRTKAGKQQSKQLLNLAMLNLVQPFALRPISGQALSFYLLSGLTRFILRAWGKRGVLEQALYCRLLS